MKKPGQQANVDVTLTTFSTRLTPAQQGLVVRAAELRGWSVANLIRIAVLEKAAHIINTSQPTRFNFRSLAKRVADQLTRPTAEVRVDETGETVQLDYFMDHLAVIDANASYKADVSSLTAEEVSELERAIRYGGSEFFRFVLHHCDESIAPDAQLPEPVDPSTLSTASEE